MKRSITSNYILNLTYQILIIALPLITTPYVSRVLGVHAIGQYSYTQSIVTYFILLGCIGLGLYGQREIAHVQDDIHARSKLFYELVILKICTIAISLLAYILFFQSLDKYSLLFWIQCIDLIANIFDINFLYQGLEDFKRIVLRNIVMRLIGIICIFTFVHSTSDLPLYIFIQSSTTILGNMIMWISLPQYVEKWHKGMKLKITRHIKSTLILFLPQIAISIYTVLDKTMIEALTSDIAQVGYYESAQKIVKLALTIVTSLGTVMMPRIASMYMHEDHQKVLDYIMMSLRFILMIAIPIMFGLIGISDHLIPWFLGEQYLPCRLLLKITAPITVWIGISNVIGIQYLLAVHKQKEYTCSTLIGCGINVTLNFILIPFLGAIGATIASLISELGVSASQLIFVKDEIHFGHIIKKSYQYMIAGCIMLVFVYGIGCFLEVGIVSTLIMILVGMSVYFMVLWIIRDELLFMGMRKILRNSGGRL